MNISLELSFFAWYLRTDEKNLQYVIICKKFYTNGRYGQRQFTSAVRRVGIKVKDINKYIFDIQEARFIKKVKLADSQVTESPAFLVKTNEGITLRDNDGRALSLKEKEMINFYKHLFVNSELY